MAPGQHRLSRLCGSLLAPEEWVMLAMAVCPVLSLLEQIIEDFTEYRRILCGCPWYTYEFDVRVLYKAQSL